jgi:hypothetical protein
MAATQNTMTVTARGVDHVSGPMKDVAKAIGGLPDKISKATSAMSALGGAVGQIGGPIGATAGKLSQFGSLVATGGPLGLGIAGVTGLVAAGTAVWQVYQEELQHAANATASLTRVFEAQKGRISEANESAMRAEQALANYGKTAGEIRIAELESKMSNFSSALERNAGVIDELRPRVAELQGQLLSLSGLNTKSANEARAAIQKELEAKRALLVATENGNAAAQAQFDANMRESLRGLAQAEEEARQKRDARTAATRRAIDAERAHTAEVEKGAQEVLAHLDRIGNELDKKKAREQAASEASKAAAKKDSDAMKAVLGKQVKAEEEAHQKRTQQAQEVASLLVDNVGGALSDIISGTKSTEEAFGEMFGSLGKMVLQQAATYVVAKGIEAAVNATTANAKIAQDTSTAASGALSAHSNIPFVGIAIGLAAAAAIIAAILSFKKFAKGGLVTGGEPGKDSVPALLMPGEMVLPVSMVREIAQLSGSGGSVSGGIPRFANGGMVQGGGQSFGTNVTINYAQNTTLPASSAQTKRSLLEIKRGFMELVHDRQLPLVAR